MKAKPLPSQEYLRECFDYDPDTGLLTWNVRPLAHFKSVRGMRLTNTRWSGSAAGTVNTRGYVVVGVSGVIMKAHRIIWMLWHGDEPGEIDHINHARTDNRIVNLRVVDRIANLHNASMYKNNKSGHVGVCWNNGASKWVARINHERNTIHLGLFGDIMEAIAARKAAEKQYGYHANHGRNA